MGLEIEPFHFPDGTKTAADAAAAIGVDVGQIVKSLDLRRRRPGRARLRQRAQPARRAQARDGCRRVDVLRVDADTVRSATGFPIGGVPPIGHASPLPVFVDPDLLHYDVVWAAAGTWTDVFAISPDDLVRVSGGTVTDSAAADGPSGHSRWAAGAPSSGRRSPDRR